MNIEAKYSHEWIKIKYNNGDDMKFIYFWGNSASIPHSGIFC